MLELDPEGEVLFCFGASIPLDASVPEDADLASEVVAIDLDLRGVRPLEQIGVSAATIELDVACLYRVPAAPY